MSMFCYQCEQTGQSTGCTSFGVCGKDPETAALQDLLVQVCKKISEKKRPGGPKGPSRLFRQTGRILATPGTSPAYNLLLRKRHDE